MEKQVAKTTFPHVIDSTMRSRFVDCPQAFFRSHIQHLAHPNKSEHLVAGGAYAKGLEVVRALYYGQGLSLDEALGEGILAAVEEYGDFEPSNPKSFTTCEKVVEVLVAYFQEFPPTTDHLVPVRKSDGTPMVEFSFAVPLDIPHPETGDPLLYCGRSDLIAQYQKNQLWIVDDKTCSQMGPSWTSSFRLRSQFTGYVWAARMYGWNVAGAITRGARFTKELAFAEILEPRPQWMVDRWLLQLHRDIERMIQCWRDNYWDYALDGACTMYSGCQFAKLCTVANPDPWIKQFFVDREWNPLTPHEQQEAEANVGIHS